MLNVSIVLYNPEWKQVVELTTVLLQCKEVRTVYWIDNSPNKTETLPFVSDKIYYIYNNRNIGYGAAHNIAIRESIYDNIPFHLVINPDIVLNQDTLPCLLSFIRQHAEVGMVMPKIISPMGELQYLCKLLPSPLDVFGRRFLPKSWMKKRNYRYELRESGYDKMMNVPYLSGCFMLMRTEAVRKARLFDERFFMYPEDMDLTRRIHREYLTVYFPHTTAIHHHAKASYHSMKMLWIHIINMCRYFNKWGWIVDNERDEMNTCAYEALKQEIQ
ncbi:MAG: glycosyltransferase family 2 protein [Paludibacteraceae bacterium]|nr:glycosyltransferase family 2 protein [Paludibacteraceae bacterium]